MSKSCIRNTNTNTSTSAAQEQEASTTSMLLRLRLVSASHEDSQPNQLRNTPPQPRVQNLTVQGRIGTQPAIHPSCRSLIFLLRKLTCCCCEIRCCQLHRSWLKCRLLPTLWWIHKGTAKHERGVVTWKFSGGKACAGSGGSRSRKSRKTRRSRRTSK